MHRNAGDRATDRYFSLYLTVQKRYLQRKTGREEDDKRAKRSNFIQIPFTSDELQVAAEISAADISKPQTEHG